METKICTKCRIEKTASEFYKDNTKKNGYRNICKACDKNNKKKTCNINIDIVPTFKGCTKCKELKHITEYGKNVSCTDNRETQCKTCKNAYYENNKERILKCGKEWRENNKELLTQKYKKYIEKNKDRVKKNKHEYYSINKDKIAEYEKKRRIDKREEIARYEKMRWQRDKNKLREYKSKWHVANKERIHKKNNRRVEKLEDSYIINNILQSTGLKHEQITPELIELKRIIIAAKRELREHKKTTLLV